MRSRTGKLSSVRRPSANASRSLVALLIAGCGGGPAALGGFEDDAGDTGATPPDLAIPECLPRTPDPCPSGSKCVYVDDGEHGPFARCVALEGEGLAGDTCTLSSTGDTCAKGRTCWAVDPSTELGVCVDNCSVEAKCASPDEACIIANEHLLAICLDACDPLDPSSCPAGWGCYDGADGRWGCDRDYSGDAGAHGSPCRCVNCCDPGLICISAALVDSPDCMEPNVDGCCAELCRVPEDDEPSPECPTELEFCHAYYSSGAVLMGYDHVGVCRG